MSVHGAHRIACNTHRSGDRTVSAFNLTYWLRKTPRPVAVMADDQRIDVPNNGRAWRDLTETIRALEPSKLTCLDGQGKVIRSIVLESDDDKPAAGAPPSAEMSDLQYFAKLIAEAYEKGRTQGQPIVDSAIGLVGLQGQRLAKSESELERARAHIYKLQMRLAQITNVPMGEADGGGESSIMGTLLAGVMQGAATQAQAAVLSPIKNGAKK
jgi:hypothetical protein